MQKPRLGLLHLEKRRKASPSQRAITSTALILNNVNDCLQSFKVDANMNGDSYSSRGMAPSSTKPKQAEGATTDNKASADSGRHGSSRDHPVSYIL
jgi:hypothetical protein